MSDSPEAPEMSPEERKLIELQTDMLKETQKASELQDMLAPILLQEAGFEVETASESVVNPQWEKRNERLQKSRQKLKRLGDEFGVDLLSDNPDLSRVNPSKIAEINRLRQEKRDLQKQRDEVDRFKVERGDITGLSEAAPSEQELLREELETTLLERQLAAARGELPVNPALLSSLDEQEADLRSQLERNLGTGFETSTPGIEALADFEQRREEILENARRGDLTMAQQLANQMGQFRAGERGQDFSTTQGVLGGFYAPASAAGGASAPLGFLQNERYMQFEAGNQAGTLGTLGAGALGYGAQTGNPYIAGAGALAMLFDD